MLRPVRIALLAGALALLAAGCGKTVIDSQKAEDFIKGAIEKQSPGSVATVSCPDNFEVKTGAEFDCTATSTSGKTLRVTMRILNDNADVKVTSVK